MKKIRGKVILPCQGDCRKLPIEDRFVDGCLMVSLKETVELYRELGLKLCWGMQKLSVESVEIKTQKQFGLEKRNN
ncbi:MAG: hypothetical protein ACE5K0_05660 [Candidatus Methanofastidiosia archaeon]